MTSTAVGLTAAIDIGSSAIRMDIAEVRSDGSLRLLDSLKKGVQLGKDAFTHGTLSEESIRAACAALADFKRVIDSYGVVRYRAVATAALRESSNSDTFLDRVLMSTGLDVEVIDGSEENRLIYSAVLESLREMPEIAKGSSLLVEIGGGSTDVTLLKEGAPLQSGTFALGSIRLRQGLGRSATTHEQQTRLLKRQVASLVTNITRSIAVKEAVNYIAVGGDVRFVAAAVNGAASDAGLWVLPRDTFANFVDSVASLSVEALVQKYAISFLDAESLAPALLAYVELLKDTQAQEVIVTNASIRSAILQELTPGEKGTRRKQLTDQILSAARTLGRKYHFDEGHADRVRNLALLLFDELKREHRLDDTQRLYLEVAALLHDIGLFVSPTAHHKHSYYLISRTDLFGLNRRDLEIIANVARYHRRALPQRSHDNYVSLDRDERVIVSKLAAILRVANALDREHLPKFVGLAVAREEDQIVFQAQNVFDLTMERAALTSRSDLFNEVFGKKIILREAAQTA